MRVFGVGIVALSLAYLALSLELPMKTLSGPGPGVFPSAVAGLLILTGISVAWSSELSDDVDRREDRSLPSVWGPSVIFAALIGFCLLFQNAGYLISGTFVMAVALKTFNASWLFAFAVSVVSVVVTYVVFVSVLGLTLPSGAWMP